MYKIMVIEDDSSLCSLIREALVKYEYEVCEPTDFKTIEEQFDKLKPDLVLMDINLPYYDGFYLCRKLRKKMNVSIIIVSARNSEMDQVLGFELGADDYVIKPFSMQVLLAKVNAVLNRVYADNNKMGKLEDNFEALYLDENTFKMYYKDKSAELSKTEFKLIKILIEKKNKVVTRDELLSEIWDENLFVSDNTLTVNISRIKNKLLDFGIEDAVKTKRGIGYLLDTTQI